MADELTPQAQIPLDQVDPNTGLPPGLDPNDPQVQQLAVAAALQAHPELAAQAQAQGLPLPPTALQGGVVAGADSAAGVDPAALAAASGQGMPVPMNANEAMYGPQGAVSQASNYAIEEQEDGTLLLRQAVDGQLGPVIKVVKP